MRTRTQAVEDYLKAIWKLSEDGGERVSVGDIAAHLSVSAPSVTGMVQKLKSLRLLNYTPYTGVTLTPRGRKIALEIIRHHRLWELYLYRRLGAPLDLVDGEAERLEHVLSDRMEDLLARALGNPTHDPHGDPIPTKAGSLEPVAAVSLLQLERGRTAVVAHVSDRDAEKLRALAALGLLPGARVTMIERGPGGRSLTLRVGTRRRTVDPALARLVRVSEAPAAAPPAPRAAGRARPAARRERRA